jgi:acetyl-CoA carboxylase carboxyltransferase component/biotin carboxyl carrier protein
MPRARHIEVQIVGDGSGAVTHFAERDCSIQRRHQKLIEISPCPSLSAGLRARLAAYAVRLAEAARYANAGTFEFLVDADGGDEARCAFIEANPRLQVEHTVTEAVHGIDLVAIQLQLAAGRSLQDLELTQRDVLPPRGFALQVRLNAETLRADGVALPASGTITAFDVPSGPGIRVDTCGRVGFRLNPNFDPLLAKLVGHSPSPRFGDSVARTARALAEFRIEGVRTNAAVLHRVLAHPDFLANCIHTGFIDDHVADLLAADATRSTDEPPHAPADPLAVLEYSRRNPGGDRHTPLTAPPSGEAMCVLHAPMQGTIVSLEVGEGDTLSAGQTVAVLNAMKMEHVVTAGESGIVRWLGVAAGDTVSEGQPLIAVERRELPAAETARAAVLDLAHIRADLSAVDERHAATTDATRADAVARRRRTGQRTARENVADLCDPDSFIEYGPLAIAAQRQRRSLPDLIARTPADGLVAGIGRVNGDRFSGAAARCAVLSYDYTVLAGTQGFQNHRKKDRLFDLIERLRVPVVFFTEGGGGRPGDVDAPGVAGLDCMAFHLFGRLSGLVPLVGINSGRCFAGNAALLGCCDVIIAARDSTIGMGGPAMIEGGGLGVFRPDEVGPMAVQVPNGVVDIAVDDEAAGVRAAKRYLSYFQGALGQWELADQRRLRALVPENRLRVYDVRSVIDVLADNDSVLELRPHFGPGMITALMRVEGRPLGVIANNPTHLAGAIDSTGADKAARFMQLCDAFDLPLLFLCDTPGIMVGPEVEKTALVRHCCRMFVVGASLTVPFGTIVLRKSYGLGAQAMAGGSHKASLFTVAWPTGEFGGMGLEGAVKLGFRNELAAIDDPAERARAFERMVARAYEHGQALNTATHFEIDDVIDPADSRRWIAGVLLSSPPPPRRRRKKRPCIDTW